MSKRFPNSVDVDASLLTRSAWTVGTGLLLLASLLASVDWGFLIWPVAIFAFGIGFLLGGLIAGVQRTRPWRAVWIVTLALPILFAICQRLPISNLDGLESGAIVSVKLTGPSGNSIDVTDPTKLAQFSEFAKSGHQSALWLTGFYCEAEIHFERGRINRKIILGDCIGSQGSGHVQEVFVPEHRGLRAWVLTSFENERVPFH